MGEVTLPTIPEYFSQKNIFITGATGFIGKVLIEKLLRSCPQIGNIYVLVRPKKGKHPQERIKAMTDLPLYDILKKTCPENLEKIVPVVGDVLEIDLGMPSEDRQKLINEVHIVYHIAASVRFDDSLKYAILMNTKGTRDVVKLTKKMKKIEVFMHFSTTYCNTDRMVIEEKMYPPHADWRTCIELAEKLDSHVLDVFAAKFTKPLPNTYTFSKSLTEHVIEDLCDGQIPSIIFRPSIVISTMTDPFPGWIDNFNGPVGILIASGKGVMRTCYANSDIAADYVPCDIVVRGVIIATWKKGTEKTDELKYKVSVYSASSCNLRSITIGEIIELGKTLNLDIPLNNILWYPDGSATNCWYYNYVRVIVYQLIPALIVDLLLTIFGKKTLLTKIQRKIFIANMALSPYLLKQWTFINKNTLQLENSLLPSDLTDFSYQIDHELAQPENYFEMAIRGARRYLLKEPDSTIEEARINAKRMWFISQIFNAAWYIVWAIIIFRIFLNIDFTSKFNNVKSIFSYFKTQ